MRKRFGLPLEVLERKRHLREQQRAHRRLHESGCQCLDCISADQLHARVLERQRAEAERAGSPPF